MSTKKQSLDQLRAQLVDSMAIGLRVDGDAMGETPEETPKPPAEPPRNPPAEEMRMIPSRYGLKPADTDTNLTVAVSEGERFDFRILARAQGVSLKDAVRGYVRACLAARRIITEEELEWLTDQTRDRS